MASEQMPRKENKTMERETHVEEQRVPKMTTNFDVTGGNKGTPQEELQGGEHRKQHAERARDSHKLGTHFESLSDKTRGEREGDQKEKKGESYSDDRAKTQNIVRDKEAETKREREGGAAAGGVQRVGKFEVRAEGKGLGEEARRSRDRAETGGQTTEATGRLGGETEGVTAVITCRLEGNEQKGRGREEEREENEQSSLEEISKYRAQAQQNAMDAISAAQERYQRAKQAASETLSGTTQTAQEKSVQAKNIAMEKAAQARDMAAQAKDVTIEKGQKGYVAAKDIAMEKATQAKDMAAQAKDVTAEKGQQGYVAAKDTISSAAKGAVDYTTPVAEKAKDYTVQAAEKAKSASGTTAQYVGEKAVQAKDATMESGKSAAKMAADLKDKATVAGWGAAHFSADKTVEGTKAAANAVQSAAGYASQKASELADKSVDTVKGLAAAAGETAKEYTARKKEEAERELEAKKAAQNQETEERTSAKASTVNSQRGQGQEQGGGKWGPGAVGQTVNQVPHTASKPHQSNTVGSFQGVQQRGTERNQDGIGETKSPYAQKIKPTGDSHNQSGQVHGHEAKGGNVSTTIGHNVDDAAQPRRVQKPHENLDRRSFQGEQGGFGQTVGQVQSQQERKGGEAMTTTDKNISSISPREQYSSENITGFHEGQEQLHGRREDGVAKPLDQVQGQQGRKGTEAMTTIGGTVGSATQREQKPFENTTQKSFQRGNEVQGKESGVVTNIGETLGDAAHRMKKPLDNVTQGGSEVLGAVGETVAEIGETMMKPAEKVQQQGQVGKGAGVLDAIGETISEIAETTKVLVVGEGETESRQSIGSDSSSRRLET